MTVSLARAREEVETYKAKLRKNENKTSEKDISITIKKFEKISKDKTVDPKVVRELQGQVTDLKKDMNRCEVSERKLKDAIKKKKQELVQERKIRKTESRKDLQVSLKRQETLNKIEKENRKILAENTKVKDENSKLKKRLSEFIFHREFYRGAYRTAHHTKGRNSSSAVSLSSYNANNLCQKRKLIGRKLSLNSFHNGARYDNKKGSFFKHLPKLCDQIQGKKMVPKSKYSTESLRRFSFNHGHHKRSISHDYSQGNQDGSSKNFESCIYKFWKQKMQSYDPYSLLNNRDLIKSIKCMACEKEQEVKPFIDHCTECRMINGVPKITRQEIQGFKTSSGSLENCDNSVSSSPKSPKQSSGGSNKDSNEQELLLTPEGERRDSDSQEVSNQNESTLIGKILTPCKPLEKSSSDSNDIIYCKNKDDLAHKDEKLFQTVKKPKDQVKRQMKKDIERILSNKRSYIGHSPSLQTKLIAKRARDGGLGDKNPSKTQKSFLTTTNTTFKSKRSSLYTPKYAKITSLKSIRRKKAGS